MKTNQNIEEGEKIKVDWTKRRKYTLRYKAELRYFDELDEDYIHLSFEGRTKLSAFNKAFHHHQKYYKEEKAKINIFDTKHPEHGEWCIESSIIRPFSQRGRSPKYLHIHKKEI